MNFNIRKAQSAELDDIYRMGYTSWASPSQREDEYLEVCRKSSKYKTGTWFVLEKNSELLSSVILYSFGEGILGLGSLATAVSVRRQGWASKLMSVLLQDLDQSHSNPATFLYSDISPHFYKRMGFRELPEKFQKHQPSLMMVRCQNLESFLQNNRVFPGYF